MKKQSESIETAKGTKKALSELNSFLLSLQTKHSINTKQMRQLLKDAQQQGKADAEKIKDNIPLCIFDNSKLSSLEAIVKYFKENLGLSYLDIAKSLNRNSGPIGITYRNAKRKIHSEFIIIPCMQIPVSIFQDRELSILENIVLYLRNTGMRYHEIALLIRRDDRTVWTVNHRAELKLKRKRTSRLKKRK